MKEWKTWKNKREIKKNNNNKKRKENAVFGFDVINVFFHISLMTGQTLTTTLICLSLFLIVVIHVDIETKRFHFLFLITAIVVPIFVSLPSLIINH